MILQTLINMWLRHRFQRSLIMHDWTWTRKTEFLKIQEFIFHFQFVFPLFPLFSLQHCCDQSRPDAEQTLVGVLKTQFQVSS